MTNAPQARGKLQWTLGDRLGKALKLENVSVAEMARELGVSRNTVGNYIADRTPVRDQTIRVWAMRTGVSFEELKFGREPNEGGPTGGGSGVKRVRFFTEPRVGFEPTTPALQGRWFGDPAELDGELLPAA